MGWWHRKRKDSRHGAPFEREGETKELTAGDFPLRLDLDGLTGHVHLTQFDSPGGVVFAWTFVTEGLRRLGQNELVLTIARRAGEAVGDPPSDPLSFFKTVQGLAAEGRIVDAGGVTLFGSARVVGFHGLIYSRLPHGVGGIKRTEGALAAIPVTRDEAVVANDFGTMRILNRLGGRYRYFPFPPWVDRDRAPLPLPESRGESVLQRTQILRLGNASAVMEADRLVVRIARTSQPVVRDALAGLSLESAFGVPLVADPVADAHLVWPAWDEEQQLSAIAPEGSRGSCVSGCCLLLAALDGESIFRNIEDGFALVLEPDAMSALRDALVRGEGLELDSPHAVCFEWVPAAYYDG